jgi:hypothetical protein
MLKGLKLGDVDILGSPILRNHMLVEVKGDVGGR